MTATDLRDLFMSSEFTQGLNEMSSYLASIMQERPIVCLLAKCLWMRGIKFKLEDEDHDLLVEVEEQKGRHIEFKFMYDTAEEKLRRELQNHGDNFGEIWSKRSGNWAVMPKIIKDVLIKQADIFVLVICSRDLSNVTDVDLNRICRGPAQRKYSIKHPYNSDGSFLKTVDLLMDKLRAERGATIQVIKHDIQTNGKFPSTYHFRICEFA